MRRSVSFLAVLACVALSAACDNSSGSTTPTPVVPVTTDTFTGTVQPMSSDAHNFTVAQAGQVAITLTSAGPPPTIFMGLGVGTVSTTDGSCSILTGGAVNAQAGTTAQLSGGANAGTFCVVVFDVGNQTAPVSYTVTVSHP